MLAHRSTASEGARIALLTSDRDFLTVAEDVRRAGINMILFIPHRHVNTIETYEKAGVEVLPIRQRGDCNPLVKAFLHEDGSGSVSIGSPCSFRDYEEETEAIKPLLVDLGYCQKASHELARPFLGHAAAKFWYSHQLGRIEVFPAPSAIRAVHQLMRHNSAGSGMTRQWLRYREELAFVLPCASRKGRSKATAVRRYGSLRDRQIYLGGGPFILRDAEDLVEQVLQRLGYFDKELNASIAEAMLVFVNATHNKSTLRKTGLLPESSDSVAAVQKKLHQAFVSTASPGIWQVVPSDRFLRRLLQKYGFLESAEAGRQAVFRAMQKCAESSQLPRMLGSS